MDKKTETVFENAKKEIETTTYRKVLTLALWVAVIGWVIIAGSDYVRVYNKKNPVFCIIERTKPFEQGTVYECIGAGYKYYKYNTPTIKQSRFGGFWINEKIQ